MLSMAQPVNRTVPVTLDPGINMLLSENRITNAEIRMGMSKISDNMQKMLDKVCTNEYKVTIIYLIQKCYIHSFMNSSFIMQQHL